ncbi:MAG: hypothetical protein ABFC73_08035 [Clostridiaceae bacterium]
MKRFLAKQFLNIVFIVLIVAAALVIYFLSRSEKQAAAAASPSPAQTAASAAEKAVFSGVPESVLITHLESAEEYTAERAKDDDRSWVITLGESPEVVASLSYTVDDGAVSSVELQVVLPAKLSKESSSSIEQYLAKNADEADVARDDAVRLLLCDLIPACDSEDALSPAQVRLWAEHAVQIKSASDDYDDKCCGCQFLTYQTQRDEQSILVCVFFANS